MAPQARSRAPPPPYAVTHDTTLHRPVPASPARSVVYISDSEDDDLYIDEHEEDLPMHPQGLQASEPLGNRRDLDEVIASSPFTSLPELRRGSQGGTAAKSMTVVHQAELEGEAEPAAPMLQPQDLDKHGVRCKCSERNSRARKHLAVCNECRVVHHLLCGARTTRGFKGFMCFTCPDGVLRQISSHSMKSSTKKRAPPRSKAQQSDHRVNKPLLKGKTARALNTSRVPQTIDYAAEAANDFHITPKTPVSTLAKRHNHRQRPASPASSTPPTSSVPHTSVQTHGPLEAISAELSAIQSLLLRKSGLLTTPAPQPDTRITDLHALFLTDLPISALWRIYCLLPNTASTPAAVGEATETVIPSHSATLTPVPRHPAPASWAQELTYRLRLLLDATTRAGTTLQLEPRPWERDFRAALRQVAMMALEAVQRDGAYRGRRAALGLLAEVVGLSGKGDFWRGGDVFLGGDGMAGSGGHEVAGRLLE